MGGFLLIKYKIATVKKTFYKKYPLIALMLVSVFATD